ncbi:MAG: fused MFS/spermidine synthase [Chitinispirillaceae bacterium]|nr:fused MFS/spermidine synthase [Chitinispirillaceae bacterium]
MIRIAVFFLFLLSGISGLVYEVVWTRLLTTILGNTIYAVSIVLSAFMAGLSIGSLIAGRYIDARKDTFALYAILETGIGVTGFCLTLLLNQTGPLYTWIHQVLSAHGIFLSLGRYLFACIILAVPTTLMGATLPVLSKFSIDRESKIGMTVGMLYAVNTFGAAVGCYAAGFLFIGNIGIIQTVFIASMINIAIGTFAWTIRNVRIAAPTDGQSKEPHESDGHKPPAPLLSVIVLVTYAVSGFAAMGYEITWTRILITYMGNTVYAFSAMLTSFLLGLALGSLLLSYFVNRCSRLFACFGMLQIGIGAYILVLLCFFGYHSRLVLPFLNPYPVVSDIPGMFLKALALMLAPTILMGASFPVATRLYVTHISTVARKVSALYSWNTIACIVGSTVTGFLLIPYIGFEKSLVFLLILNIGSGVALLAAEPFLRFPVKVPAVIAVLVCAAAGIMFTPRAIIHTMHETVFHKEEKIIYYQETPYGIVEVLKNPSGRRLVQDDFDIAGTGLTYCASQKPLGHLPMLLHPHPQSVFIIGFGAGGTSYAVNTYAGVKSIAVAELNQGIINTAPLFSDINHGILADPKCSLSINDGRHFLLTTRSRYDVISVDLLWPQSAGAGSLYTKEFYRLCFDRLNEKGIMTEWLHTNYIPQAHVRTILKTIRQVFPYAALWTSRSFGHLFLVASKDPRFSVDYRSFLKKIRTPEVARDLSEIALDDPAVFVSYFIADGAALDSIIVSVDGINTDNLPIIEYKLPFNRNPSWYDNAVGIMRLKRPVLPLLHHIDSIESRRIMLHEQTMKMVLQSKMNHTRGDPEGAITLCTGAFRANPANPEAAAWYSELKQAIQYLIDTRMAPPEVLSAFDTSDATNTLQNRP